MEKTFTRAFMQTNVLFPDTAIKIRLVLMKTPF